MNDGAALGCYAALAEFGLKVPGDVSVVGYGNLPYGRYVSPPLTSVSLPQSAAGKEAVAQVLRLLGDGGAEPAHVQLKPHLVHRHSTAPPPQA
jgi:DNA-binding LacI/PurR family transcriptional regulator